MTESSISTSIVRRGFIFRAQSHRLTELPCLAAADLINNALEPVGRREDRADLARIIEKPKDGNAVRFLGEERLVARRQFLACRRNGHPERAHELELFGCELNGRANRADVSDPHARAVRERYEELL